MVHLPSASKIPVLTDANIMLVAETHLNQLRSGTSRNPVGAQDFVESTIRLLEFARDAAQGQRDEALNCLTAALRYAPHVRLEMEKIDICEALVWLAENEIAHELVHLDREDIFLFEDYDDSILFKLRWG
jgi:hypothetical protein